jgi:hypothetical protein
MEIAISKLSLTSFHEYIGVLRLEANRLQDRVSEDICALRNEDLFEFVVDCSVDVGGEIFGVVCEIPQCCTRCTALVG